MAAATPLESRMVSNHTAGFLFDPILQTHDLSIGYATRHAHAVATGLDLTLHAGELVCLIGPNGAGKSTLLRTLAGMQPPLAGSVALMGDDVQQLAAREIAQRLSVVLTERVSPGLLTAYTLVALGRHPYTDWSGRLTAADDVVVSEAIHAVGADTLSDRLVGELSDGEKQKIMIARALAQEPVLMILDEPTAFLDLPRRVEIMQLLRKLAHEQQRAILLSTHDLDLALRNADQIWLFASDGSLRVGAPEDLVLSGAFAEAFSAEGVAFDPKTGAFRSNLEAQKTVKLSGTGLALIWTRRALERAGFNVTDGDSVFARVEISDQQRWRLTIAGSVCEYQSVGELIAGLRTIR